MPESRQKRNILWIRRRHSPHFGCASRFLADCKLRKIAAPTESRVLQLAPSRPAFYNPVIASEQHSDRNDPTAGGNAVFWVQPKFPSPIRATNCPIRKSHGRRAIQGRQQALNDRGHNRYSRQQRCAASAPGRWPGFHQSLQVRALITRSSE